MEPAGAVRRVRLERWSPRTAKVAGVVSFLPLLLVAWLLSALTLVPVAYGIGLPTMLVVALFLGTSPVLAAYFCARKIYRAARWRVVNDADGRYCIYCTYDLTGNRSGVCPECGAVVLSEEDRARDAGDGGRRGDDEGTGV